MIYNNMIAFLSLIFNKDVCTINLILIKNNYYIRIINKYIHYYLKLYKHYNQFLFNFSYVHISKTITSIEQLQKTIGKYFDRHRNPPFGG